MSHVVSSSAPITSAHTVKQYAGFGILGADIPTTGDNGGSPVLNDGTVSTSEYYWRVETPPSDGVLTIYPDLTFEWDAAGVPDGSYPWVYRLFENRSDVGTATVNQILGAITLAIADALHTHAADSLTLSTTGSASLAIAEASHGHTADSLTLTTQWLLAIADALHAHAADNVALATTGSASLAIAEATHAHAADNLLLTTQRLLAIADALHAHAADSLVLDTSSAVWLTLQDATHGHAAETVILTLSTWLAIAESQHSHLADNVLIDPGYRALSIANAVHAHLAENAVLTTSGIPGSCPTAEEIAVAVWSYLSRSMPSTERAAVAAEVLAAAQATPIHADMQMTNGVEIVGDGTSADKFRSALYVG